MHPNRVNFSSHPHPFGLNYVVCSNPECDCEEISFRLCELLPHGKSDRLPWQFDVRVHVPSWEEVDPPPQRPDAVSAIADELLRDYPLAERRRLESAMQKKRQIAQRLRDCRVERRYFDEGALVSFRHLIHGSGPILSDEISCSVFEVSHDGTIYLIDDLYCPRPDCDCDQIQLSVCRVVAKNQPGQTAATKDAFSARISLSGETAVIQCATCTRSEAEKILHAWQQQESDLTEELNWRWCKVKEIGRRSAPPSARPHQTFAESKPIVRTEHRSRRNERCACGSGKKFKNCCGRRTNPVATIANRRLSTADAAQH